MRLSSSGELTVAVLVLAFIGYMSAKRLHHPHFPAANTPAAKAAQIQLTVSMNAVVLRPGGIEFRSITRFSPWTEMSMDLEGNRGADRVHCNGVVVSCTRSKHVGYRVSMVFTSLTRNKG